MGLIGAIIVGLLAGFIAEKVMKRNHGLLTNLLVGLGGAVLGALIAGVLGLEPRNIIGNVVIASAGAILLLYLLSRWKRSA